MSNAPGSPSTGTDRFSFRRMLKVELQNSISDLLGLPMKEVTQLSAELPDDQPRSNGYRFPHPLKSQYLEALSQSIEAAVSRASWSAVDASWAAQCPPEQAPSQTRDCAVELVRSFADRAYRRPLSEAELEELAESYDTFRSQSDPFGHEEALRATLQVILLAPQFLYHWEAPEDAAENVVDGRATLTAHERAARLSFFLWGSVPDIELRAAVDGGMLDESTWQLQVHRLLDDSRSAFVLEQFVPLWLQTVDIEERQRTGEDGVELSSALLSLMQEEVRQYTAHVMATSGDLPSLLNSQTAPSSPELNEFYSGGEATTAPGELLPVPAPEGRHGIFSLGAVLVSHSTALEPSPTRYGKFVRTRILCDEIPPPPPDVDPTLPEPEDGVTLRERLEAHIAAPACNGCHSLMDPIGFSVLEFDVLGRRTRIGADSSGVVTQFDDGGQLVFGNLSEMAAGLAQSEKVRRCFSQQMLRYLTGNDVLSSDPAINGLDEQFGAAGSNLRALLVALSNHDIFKYRTPLTQGSL